MDDVYALILAGGSGTRFWPASRTLRPKQLLGLGRDANSTLLAETLHRIAPIVPIERVFISTGEHLAERTLAALPDLASTALLSEPMARNTAPCIAWGASVIARQNPDAIVIVLPSDHQFDDADAFRTALGVAVESARTGHITTIGLRPTRPETGYGYIEAGEAVGGGALRVARFVEKPDRARAEQYVATGRYYWNSGMFVFRANTLLAAVTRHLPDLSEGIRRIESAHAHGVEAETKAVREVFENTASISIDYGIMERETALHVVPAELGWSDLGSWEAAWEFAERDADANTAPREAILIDARGNLVRDLRSKPGERTVALVGVDDLCVVVTDDAVLVMPKERSQDVREVVAALRAAKRDALL